MVKKTEEVKQERVAEEECVKPEESVTEAAVETEEKAESDSVAELQPEPLDAKAVNEALCALEDEKEEYKNALVRERADFENYKKRNADATSVSYKNGISDTVCAILPVLDNFERALLAESVDKAFQDGMAMIMRQLLDVLKTLGVEEIPTDCKFDPAVHDAVMQTEEEGFETNDIVETMQKGYRLKDKILRHAMVKVNK